MKNDLFHDIINSIPKLTNNQKHLVSTKINTELNSDETGSLIDRLKIEDEVCCPRCGSLDIGKWGFVSNLQRYKCKEDACGRTFNALTNTPLARLRKRDKWQANLDCMTDALPIWRVAEELNVAISTAFRWRHRFLKAPTLSKPSEVAGIIEADEMFFPTSLKGQRNIEGRKPRKRGGMGNAKEKGDRVPVLIVRDRSGGLTDFVLKSPCKEDVHSALKPIVNENSVLCSDGAMMYKSFAKENNIKHYRCIISQGTRVIKKTFHIQGVNGYMGRFRTWMARFNGVNSNYLQNYLGWMRTMEGIKKNGGLNLNLLMGIVLHVKDYDY
jgi:transposase-like protein